ncbi:MAG: esterase/lipase family protein [Candidatus Binatia bacterium]
MRQIIQDAALVLAETVSAAELGMLIWRASDLQCQPHGKGEPVVVLPGFGADDMSTWLLRRYLRYLDYRVYRWKQGVNCGDVPSMVTRVTELARRCADKTGKRVRLVGWSLGGTIAREIARDEPLLVERVITMGSPVRIPRHLSARHCFSMFGNDVDAMDAEMERRTCTPIQVPVTAIYAAYDGFVSRTDCIDSCEGVEQVEVRTTHLGLGMNADVYRIVAQRLATLTTRLSWKPRKHAAFAMRMGAQAQGA